MEQYYKVSIKNSYEDKKGNIKFKRENYIVTGISPTDVEEKLSKHLGMNDFEIISISLMNIINVIS